MSIGAKSTGSKKRKIYEKEIIGLALSAMLFALCFSAEAQQPAKVPKIGWLGARPDGQPAGQEIIPAYAS